MGNEDDDANMVVSKRKRVLKKSIDAPAGDGENSNGFELEYEDDSKEKREKARHTLSRLLSVVRPHLSKSQNKLMTSIEEMGDDAFGEDGLLSYGLIANRTGLSDSNVGSMMSVIKKKTKELSEK